MRLAWPRRNMNVKRPANCDRRPIAYVGIDPGRLGHLAELYILRLKSLHQFDRVLPLNLSI
jgi:hypothetical protein